MTPNNVEHFAREPARRFVSPPFRRETLLNPLTPFLHPATLCPIPFLALVAFVFSFDSPKPTFARSHGRLSHFPFEGCRTTPFFPRIQLFGPVCSLDVTSKTPFSCPLSFPDYPTPILFSHVDKSSLRFERAFVSTSLTRFSTTFLSVESFFSFLCPYPVLFRLTPSSPVSSEAGLNTSPVEVGNCPPTGCSDYLVLAKTKPL